MKKATIWALVIVALALAGVGVVAMERSERHRRAMLASITRWTVCDRGHREAYTTTFYTSQRIGKDFSIMIPHTSYHPERWWLVWEGTDTEGTRRERREDVSQDRWNQARVGEVVDVQPEGEQ